MIAKKFLPSNNPNKDNEGKRGITISKHIFIDKNDFMEIPEKKYFRLAPGKEVRLRHAFNIVCNNIVKDDSGKYYRIRVHF
jgi:glutaminyl-tRNA synthetase